ncbi:MAG TPA: ATP-binding protein, partial [Archangium sp.]
ATTGGFTVPYRKEFIHKAGRRVPVLLCCAFISGSERWVGYVVNLAVAHESAPPRPEGVSNLQEPLPAQFHLRFISELVRERERLTQLLDSSSSPIWAVDRELRLLSANSAYQSMHRAFVEKVLDVGGSVLGEPLPEEVRRPWAGWYQRALEGERFVVQTPPSPVHGARQAIDYSLSPIRDGMGRVLGASVVGQDVSFRVRAEEAKEEKRQLELRLIQAQKMEAVGQLAGGVAHDFNNILTAMLLQIEELFSTRGIPAPALDGLRELQSQTQRSASLTHQLLLFSRQQVLQARPVELNALISGLVRMLRRLIGEHLTLAFTPGGEDLWFVGDSGTIEQVLTNLVVNSRDAMPEGGRVLIRPLSRDVSPDEALRRNPLAKAGPHVGFEVVDQGHGIAPELLSRVFEPFYTTKEAGKGTGLGLATAYGIAQQHRGWLDVESVQGQGSTFRLWLPAVAAPQAEAAAEHRPLPLVTPGRERVLLVEDETSVREHLVRTLQRHGYVVVGVADGPSALHAWASAHHAFDLVVSDMKMPGGLTGLRLVQQLSKEQPALKSVLISGYVPSPEDREVMERTGAVLLSKPFTAEQFARAVGRVLGR